MFQVLKAEIYDLLIAHVSNDILILISLGIALLAARSLGRSRKERLQISLLVGLTAIAAYLGARVLHVLIERPELLSKPEMIFARFDGMTFNGSLLFGLATFAIGARALFDRELRFKLWDRAALVVAFSYGLLRLGCFANGCCWGKVSAVPWAVKYFDSRFMPWHGIPVHPVQLYDSLLGFAIFAGLLFLQRNARLRSGTLFPIFLISYGIGRFLTEFYRGDAFRGENIFFELSTSQAVSIVLVTAGALGIVREKLIPVGKTIAVASLALVLSGCLLPQSPEEGTFQRVEKIRPGLERYTSNLNRHRLSGPVIRRGNALILTADSFIYKSLIARAPKGLRSAKAPGLDDLVWWEYAPVMTQMYRTVIRISIDEAKAKTLSDALLELEALGEPYDVYLLSHGMPNHLSSGEGYFFSFRDLAQLKDRLTHLNLVFMQACYSSTLVGDWLSAGAKAVLSFPGANRNFFWISFFLRWYRYYDPGEAYRITNATIDFNLKNELLYLKLLQTLGLSPETYLAQSPSPVLDTRE